MKNEATDKKSNLLAGGVTQAQIDAWKKEHGKIYSIAVPTNDNAESDKVTGYFKKPNLATISAAASAGNDILRVGNIMLENLFLGGDPEIKANEEVKMSVIAELSKLFKIRQAEVGEL